MEVSTYACCGHYFKVVAFQERPFADEREARIEASLTEIGNTDVVAFNAVNLSGASERDDHHSKTKQKLFHSCSHFLSVPLRRVFHLSVYGFPIKLLTGKTPFALKMPILTQKSALCRWEPPALATSYPQCPRG